jgi:hypothetical protein
LRAARAAPQRSDRTAPVGLGTIDARPRGVRTVALASIVLAVLSTACAGSPSPVAPTTPVAITPSASVNLTVRVLTRGTEVPITGARVFQNSAAVGTTNAGGELRTNVPVDVEFQIDVTAPGYVGFGVTGTVRGEERWTFYLEPQ